MEEWKFMGFFESLCRIKWGLDVRNVGGDSYKWSVFWFTEIIEEQVQLCPDNGFFLDTFGPLNISKCLNIFS